MLKYIAFIVISIATSGHLSAQYIIDKVVAKVGGEIVLLSDIEDQISYIKSNGGTLTGDESCQILNSVIAQKLIVHQAKLDSIEVLPAEVEAQLNYRFDNVLAQMNGDESFFEEYYGADIQEMKNKYREDQKQQILLERMQQQLISNVRVTPEEVQQFYDGIPKDSLPFLNSEVEISELVYSPKVNKEESTKAETKLEEVREMIVSGKETFQDMAKKYSMDGSAANGGDLGFAKRGMYVPEFEAAAYPLKKDEISEVIESQFGFHIIQMIERRGNKINVRHILIKPEITFEDLSMAEEKANSIAQDIRTDSLKFAVAVRKYGDDDTQSFNNGGRMKNPKTGNTFFETADLSPEIYFAMESLELGGVTEPLEFTTPAGETKYRIIKLDSRTNPHRVDIVTDYAKIQQIAKENKKNEILAEWIEDKYETTYIKVSKDYGNCEDLSKYVTEVSK